MERQVVNTTTVLGAALFGGAAVGFRNNKGEISGS